MNRLKGSEIYENAKGKVTEYLKKDDKEVLDISDIDFEEEGGLDGDQPAGRDDSADK